MNKSSVSSRALLRPQHFKMGRNKNIGRHENKCCCGGITMHRLLFDWTDGHSKTMNGLFFSVSGIRQSRRWLVDITLNSRREKRLMLAMNGFSDITKSSSRHSAPPFFTIFFPYFCLETVEMHLKSSHKIMHESLRSTVPHGAQFVCCEWKYPCAGVVVEPTSMIDMKNKPFTKRHDTA